MNFAGISISTALLVLATLISTGCGGGRDDDGDTVTCNDGWVSHSKGQQGACSSHGGVKG
jgi:hypothetical protein